MPQITSYRTYTSCGCSYLSTQTRANENLHAQCTSKRLTEYQLRGSVQQSQDTPLLLACNIRGPDKMNALRLCISILARSTSNEQSHTKSER